MSCPGATPGTTVRRDQRAALIKAARYFRSTIDSGDVVDAAVELADLVLAVFGERAARPQDGTGTEGHPGQITLAYWVPCRFTETLPAEEAARILRTAGLDQAAAVADRIAAGEPVTGGGSRLASDGGDSDLAVLIQAIQDNHHLFAHYLTGPYSGTGEPDEPGDFGISITVRGPAGSPAAG